MPFVIEKTIEINAPASTVWGVITDFAHYGEWNPFVVECRSALKPGEPIDMRVKLGMRTQKQREWIQKVEPGRGFTYSMMPAPLGALSSARSHDVKAIGSGRSRYRSYFQLDGWMKGLVLGLFQKSLEKGFAGMTDGIRRRAEEQWIRDQAARGGG